jgi:hypothetical protein
MPEIPNAHHAQARTQQSNAQPSTAHKPFVIEVRQDRPQPTGSFVPAASLKLMEEFRTTGLLHFLSPEDLKSLLYLLTFITPEGHCQVSLPILTSAMQVSSSKVKARMHRLSEMKWQDEPLIIQVPHESGLFTYSLHPHLVAYEHLTVSEQHPTPPLRTVSRNQIIAYSRSHYARPRAEVEKIIAAQLGQDIEETVEQRKLRYRLENVGLTSEQATEVVLTHSPDVIAQQLDWLPFRNAKNPAGYLLAAIEGGYGEPRGVREERVLRELRYGEMQSGEQPLSEEQVKEPEAEDRIEEQGLDEGQGAAIPVSENPPQVATPQNEAVLGEEIATLEEGGALDLTTRE